MSKHILFPRIAPNALRTQRCTFTQPSPPLSSVQVRLCCVYTWTVPSLCQSTARSDLAIFNAPRPIWEKDSFHSAYLAACRLTIMAPFNKLRGNSQLNTLKGDTQRPPRERLQVWNACFWECCKCMAAFKFACAPLTSPHSLSTQPLSWGGRGAALGDGLAKAT